MVKRKQVFIDFEAIGTFQDRFCRSEKCFSRLILSSACQCHEIKIVTKAFAILISNRWNSSDPVSSACARVKR